MCVFIAVLVEEHPITERLRELERAMDSGLRSERAELRRQVKEQFAIPDIDMTTVSDGRGYGMESIGVYMWIHKYLVWPRALSRVVSLIHHAQVCEEGTRGGLLLPFPIPPFPSDWKRFNPHSHVVALIHKPTKDIPFSHLRPLV